MLQENTSRKSFISWLGWLLFAGVVVVWDTIADKQLWKANIHEKIKISGPIPQGLTINGRVIIFRSNDNLTVYSAKCTHLGCIINKLEGEKLICQCHGSVFSNSGKPEKGPASHPLSVLNYTNDGKGGIIVDVVE
ncbi:MAG: ubiquinol-cytochrome c reductase iron-sulfur subunit [Ignavibacteriales bacterium]